MGQLTYGLPKDFLVSYGHSANMKQTCPYRNMRLNLKPGRFYRFFVPALTKAVAGIVSVLALGVPLQSDASVVAYWNFDSNFAATAGGSDFDLDAFNGASRSSTESRYGGSSASFSRASNQYLFTDSGSGNLLDRNSDFSYSAWYYLDVADISGSGRYFVMESTENDSVGGAQSHPVSFGLRDQGAGDVGQVYTSVNNTSDRHYQWSTTPNQQWHNVITTYDSSTGTLTSYFNGVEVGTSEVPFVGVNDDEQPGTSIDIGNGLVIGGHRAGTGRTWEGYIDDVAVWDSVIDSSEISRLQSNPVIVPEPAAATMLLGLGALAVAALRRR